MKTTQNNENNPPRPFKKQGDNTGKNSLNENEESNSGVKQDSVTFERDIEQEKQNDVERTLNDKNEGQPQEKKNEGPKIEPGVDDNIKTI